MGPIKKGHVSLPTFSFHENMLSLSAPDKLGSVVDIAFSLAKSCIDAPEVGKAHCKILS